MATLYYTKRFDSGPLKGLSVNCSISCVDSEAISHYAKAYRIGMRGKESFSKATYTITDASFQKGDG